MSGTTSFFSLFLTGGGWGVGTGGGGGGGGGGGVVYVVSVDAICTHLFKFD